MGKKRGTVQWYADEHETYIANRFQGKKVSNSGSTALYKSDVVTTMERIECKYTGNPSAPAKSISVKVDDLNKIYDQATETNRFPLMALRIWNDQSPLANREGWIDLIVRPLDDDIERRIRCLPS